MKFSPDRILRSVHSWEELRKQIDGIGRSKAANRKKGDVFERFLQLFFTHHPDFAVQLDTVWLYEQIPDDVKEAHNLPPSDRGVDLLTRTKEGEYWTIKEMEVQVKPYQQPHLPVYMVSSGSGNSIRVAAERGLGVISGVYSPPTALNISQQWQTYEDLATQAGHTPSREEWRLSTNIYVADSMEEALNDVSAGILNDVNQYFFHIGAKPSYESYPGQPAEEITAEQIIEQRKWIIGDPDHCVRLIKELDEATGGFGSLLMVSVEWTSSQKWNRSLELFARYVMPQFKGSLRGIQSSYDRMVEDHRLGRLPSGRVVPADGGQASRQ